MRRDVSVKANQDVIQRPRRWWVPLLLAGLAHSLLMILAFDPVGFWPAAFVAITPLVWAACRDTRVPGVADIGWFRLGLWVWVGCVPLYLFEQGWSLEVSAGGYALMAAYLALYPALMVVLLRQVHRRFPGLPVGLTGGLLWTALEVMEGDVAFKGYNWFDLAHPLAQWPAAAACGAVVGMYGATLLLALVGACVGAMVSRNRPRAQGLVLAATLVLWTALSWWGWSMTEADPPSSSRLRVGVVQTNLPQSNKISPDLDTTMALWKDMETLTIQAAAAEPRPDVIVWPETMKPGMALEPDSLKAEREAKVALFPRDPASRTQPVLTASFADATLALNKAAGIPMLVGEDGYDGLKITADAKGRLDVTYRHRYNSAFLLRDGVVLPGRYDKVRLTPFGEEMPYISAWPWLESQLMDLAAHGMRLDLSAGHDLTVFSIPAASGHTARLVTPICFEATEWDLCRRMVFENGQRRADLMVNMTNDGWFGWWKSGRTQHLEIARWRCIELGTPMVRAANTGVSCSIDTHGRVRRIAIGPDKVDWKASGVFLADVELRPGVTPFVRGGWMTGWVLFAAGCLLAALSFIPRRAASRTSQQSAT